MCVLVIVVTIVVAMCVGDSGDYSDSDVVCW